MFSPKNICPLSSLRPPTASACLQPWPRPFAASPTSLGISRSLPLPLDFFPPAVPCALVVLPPCLVGAHCGEGWREGVSRSRLTQCRLGPVTVTQAAFVEAAEGRGWAPAFTAVRPLLAWLWAGPSCPIRV